MNLQNWAFRFYYAILSQFHVFEILIINIENLLKKSSLFLKGKTIPQDGNIISFYFLIYMADGM